MDFSSVPRALESLRRRKPALDDHVLELVARLESSTPNANDHVSALIELLIGKDAETTEGKEGESKDENAAKERWESLAVGLYMATELLKANDDEMTTNTKDEAGTAGPPTTVYMEGPRVPNMINQEKKVEKLEDEELIWKLCQTLHTIALQHLEHSEPRVRTLVAKAVSVYCRISATKKDSGMHKQVYECLVTSIRQHISDGRDTNNKQLYSQSSTGALDDTTGWRALETNWQCLAALVSALGSSYWSEFDLDQQLLDDCQYSCITHVNRHVRAAAMAVLEQWIVAAAAADKEILAPEAPLRTTTKTVLLTGLADNWSQVRMAASVLCRVLFTQLKNEDIDDLLRVLLPRMCLNRFYLAQGVKLYSHETWVQVMGDSGLDRVAQYLPAVVRYYTKMCDADNHVVREAACQAIAELAVKFGADRPQHAALEPHVDVLLQALLMCFHDESWPVRDEACLACGLLAKSFPEECRPELKVLWERWTEQLTDQIWSVRQDAAVALGDALQAYGNDFLQELLQLVKKLLPSARDQPAMTPEEYKAHQNDMAAHTDSQLYSCGSLAPKLRKGGAGRIGCSSCGINRPKAPWEATDGCVYLICELTVHCSNDSSKTPLSDAQFLELFTELVDVCRVQHFPQASDLRATLWRQLPVMARAFGKQRFKTRFLSIFMDLLFRNLDSRSDSQLSIHAAGQCLEELSQLIGPAMLRGRLEFDDQKATFDRVMRERQAMPKGPAAAASFSPFGPPGLLDGIAAPY